MPLFCRPFWWPWWGVEAIHAASMQHVHGYTGSNWTPPSGDYLLCIASAATRATANKTTMYYVPTLMAISMVIVMQRYYTERITWWRMSRAFIKAPKHRHRASTRSDSINRTRQHRLFLRFHHEKGLELTCWPLITIGVWHIKLMRCT